MTAALAARQGLIERWRATPQQAIARLTPLQAQHPPAPYIGLAARLHGFERRHLEHAIDQRHIVKTTINRQTLHLVHRDAYPAYAQLTRQTRMRTWRKTYAHLDEQRVTHELTRFFQRPRTNPEIRERMLEYEPEPEGPWTAVLFARTLLPLIQLPPAGHWNDPRRAEFIQDPRPLPSPGEAARAVLIQYLRAFGPAGRRDAAGWAGVAQRDFAFDDGLVTYEDEHGRTLYDLPGQPLPPTDTPLPIRFLGHWDQTLLAYKDRERILPPELAHHQHTITGSPTVTVDGRVAASWSIHENRLTITAHTDLPDQPLRDEALRTARFCAPGFDRHEIVVN